MEFARQSDSTVEVVTDIATYLMAGGGKRIRPLLLLLSAKSLQSDNAGRIRMGAVVEMLHTATLVHDDIIDEVVQLIIHGYLYTSPSKVTTKNRTTSTFPSTVPSARSSGRAGAL